MQLNKKGLFEFIRPLQHGLGFFQSSFIHIKNFFLQLK